MHFNGFSIDDAQTLYCGNGNCVLSIMVAKAVLEAEFSSFLFLCLFTTPQYLSEWNNKMKYLSQGNALKNIVAKTPREK